MNINFETIYEKGSGKENEDGFVINKEAGLFAVLDGATALVKNNVTGATASSIVKAVLDKENHEGNLLTTILKANRILGTRVLEYFKEQGYKNVESIPKVERSTTGAIAIKIHHNRLEYVQAGDCMLFVQYENGEIRTLTYDQVSALDQLSIEKAQEVHSKLEKQEPKGDIHQIVRERILPIIKKNRNMLNTDQGYGILDGSKEAERFLESGSITLNNVKKILLLSDGLQLPNVKAGGIACWEETAKLAFDKGLEHLYQTVQGMEDSDPEGKVYPRLKPSDDKTGILITSWKGIYKGLVQ